MTKGVSVITRWAAAPWSRGALDTTVTVSPPPPGEDCVRGRRGLSLGLLVYPLHFLV